jgi:hypothetical protein
MKNRRRSGAAYHEIKIVVVKEHARNCVDQFLRSCIAFAFFSISFSRHEASGVSRGFAALIAKQRPYAALVLARSDHLRVVSRAERRAICGHV